MYNLNKYKLLFIGYNKIDTSRMAVHSINTSCHQVQILECNGTVLLHIHVDDKIRLLEH